MCVCVCVGWFAGGSLPFAAGSCVLFFFKIANENGRREHRAGAKTKNQKKALKKEEHGTSRGPVAFFRECACALPFSFYFFQSHMSHRNRMSMFDVHVPSHCVCVVCVCLVSFGGGCGVFFFWLGHRRLVKIISFSFSLPREKVCPKDQLPRT